MATVDESNVIKTAAAKPFFYRDLAVKKLQDNPDSTVVISGLGSGAPLVDSGDTSTIAPFLHINLPDPNPVGRRQALRMNQPFDSPISFLKCY